MSTTIDHLRVDHRVTILHDFVDESGTQMRTGETGVLRKLSFDQLKSEILMEIERKAGTAFLRFALRADDGPRNGHMREFFEVGDDVSVPRKASVRYDQVVRKMIVPAGEVEGATPDLEGPDRLVDVENAMREKIDHIGVAVSIAEMYAERMRGFQRLGDEPRAVAAFKLAADWMGTYASWATSGGEGTANSNERDRFCEALVAEFGYDPRT